MCALVGTYQDYLLKRINLVTQELFSLFCSTPIVLQMKVNNEHSGYWDASLDDCGIVLKTSLLKKLLEFDRETTIYLHFGAIRSYGYEVIKLIKEREFTSITCEFPEITWLDSIFNPKGELSIRVVSKYGKFSRVLTVPIKLKPQVTNRILLGDYYSKILKSLASAINNKKNVTLHLQLLAALDSFECGNMNEQKIQQVLNLFESYLMTGSYLDLAQCLKKVDLSCLQNNGLCLLCSFAVLVHKEQEAKYFIKNMVYALTCDEEAAEIISSNPSILYISVLAYDLSQVWVRSTWMFNRCLNTNSIKTNPEKIANYLDALLDFLNANPYK